MSLPDSEGGQAATMNRDEPESAKDYVLATGTRAIERLRLLDEIFGPASRRLLMNLGVSTVSRVAELGCGTGLMSMWMAKQAGPEASVYALDSSEGQLATACENAKAVGLKNISFQLASAYNTRLPHGSFDLVYSRFLMCHLTDPGGALKEMWNLLRTGGTLVCEDFEMGAVSSSPPTKAYKQLVRISRAADLKLGVDSDVGARLHTLMVEAGCERPEVSVYQPALLRGRGKHFWEMTLREAEPAIIARGIVTSDELSTLCQDLAKIAEDDSILVLIARVYQIWCRKR